MIDQIRYQVAAGVLKKGNKVPSVRELALKLAVNQNTILKVYNELCRENIFRIERGDGTYVAGEKLDMPAHERREMVAGPLRGAAVMAIQLGVSAADAAEILKTEYDRILSQKQSQGKEQGDA
jgi:GntR family transcriptional regulator